MTDPLPVAVLVHGMPGRARLRLSSRRGDTGFFTALAAGLSAHPGVTKVEVAALTGSVLIRHFGRFEEIGAAAEKAGLFRIGETEASAATPPPVERRKLPVDPKLALAAGLGVTALWQLAQGKALPPALTLAWYAMRLSGFAASSQSSDASE